MKFAQWYLPLLLPSRIGRYIGL